MEEDVIKESNYSASNIQVLEGLEAVRKRPAMYIGDISEKGLHHLVNETVDNSIDEAMAGYCTHIEVTINEDESITVQDNGRGIPVDEHKKLHKSALEVVMTVLHAGGKFDKGSYKVSGGLHGVGVSCVNALSTHMLSQVFRDGKIYQQEYEKGKPLYPVKVVGETELRGTRQQFWPDGSIFTTTTYKYDIIAKRMRELAYLNAVLIENINPLANLVRVPKKQTALLGDFEVKRDRIARETMGKDVTNISGVPSWMLSVLSRVMELTGKSHLEEVWPNLEVFFHGGVAFTPYRKQYEQLITSPRMHYMETYNASEGFFGLQDDPADKAMLLMLDYDVFYEFIPMDEFGRDGATAVPLWGVEKGKNYAMVISTSCGLWRYVLGDTVSFTSLNPYKFVITGRTKHFINAFGEELIVDNAEQGLAYACQQTGASVSEYTAAPVFMDGKGKCRHQWLIEFSHEPASLQEFASLLDRRLQEVNSDYEAKRFKDITLQHLEVVKARTGLFNDWLKAKGKLGGQHKVPRLSNNRDTLEQLLRMNGLAKPSLQA